MREDQIVLHDFLIDLRNNHVAHAGSKKFSVSNLVAQISDSSVNIFLSGLSLSSFNYNIDGIEELIYEVLKICEQKSEKAYQSIINELRSRNKEDLEKDSFLRSNYKIYSLEEIQNEIIKLNKDYYEN